MESQIPGLLCRTADGKMSRLGILKQMGHSRSRSSFSALSKAINGLCLDGVVEKIGGHSICLAGDIKRKKGKSENSAKDAKRQTTRELVVPKRPLWKSVISSEDEESGDEESSDAEKKN